MHLSILLVRSSALGAFPFFKFLIALSIWDSRTGGADNSSPFSRSFVLSFLSRFPAYCFHFFWISSFSKVSVPFLFLGAANFCFLNLPVIILIVRWNLSKSPQHFPSFFHVLVIVHVRWIFSKLFHFLFIHNGLIFVLVLQILPIPLKKMLHFKLEPWLSWRICTWIKFFFATYALGIFFLLKCQWYYLK